MTTLQFFGRLHPLALHFPIALLLLAAVVEIIRCFRDTPLLARATVWSLFVGAVGAVAATATGWVFAYESNPEPALRSVLQWHRWLGVGTACLALLAWGVAARWSAHAHATPRWLARVTAWGAAVMLAITAHLGALIVWGLDYFS